MRRAVLGGSFDPIHRGHIAMADAVLGSDLIDCLHVIPAWRSPFKTGPGSSAAHRLAMVNLAFAHRKNIVVETMELDRASTSYTVSSLSELNKRYPADSLFLILGSDNLSDLGRWRQVDRIAKLASLIILGRNQLPITISDLNKLGFSKSRVFTLPDFDYPVSSTMVRKRLIAGHRSIAELTPDVASYIRSNGLYEDS